MTPPATTVGLVTTRQGSMGLAAFGRPAHRIGWSVYSGTGELRPPTFLQDKSLPPDAHLTVGGLGDYF